MRNRTIAPMNWWKNHGFVIYRGERALYYDVYDRPMFSRDQVYLPRRPVRVVERVVYIDLFYN